MPKKEQSDAKLAAVRVAKLQRAITQAHLKAVKHQSNRCSSAQVQKKRRKGHAASGTRSSEIGGKANHWFSQCGMSDMSVFC